MTTRSGDSVTTSKRKQVLTRRDKVQKLSTRPVCAFDFETDGLGGEFIVAGYYTVVNGVSYYQVVYTLNDALNLMLNRPEYLYIAHNAGGYEINYLLDSIQRHYRNRDDVSIDVQLQGDDNVIQVRITTGKKTVTIRDTLCLFNMSLEQTAQAFAPELPKLQVIDFDKERFDINNSSHMAYLKRDCETLYTSYIRLRKLVYDRFQVSLPTTSGGLSMAVFRSLIPDETCYFRNRKPVEDFIRKCYYGGATFPGRKVGKIDVPITSLDIHAAYAYQQKRHKYPINQPFYTTTYHPGKDGFYRVVVAVSPGFYEDHGYVPVPYRSQMGLLWPVGRYETHLSSVDIDYARSVGIEVEVVEGYVFRHSEDVFSKFIELCEELEHEQDGVYKALAKMLRLTLYGKFGMKRYRKKYIYTHDIMPYIKQGMELWPILDVKTGKQMIEGGYYVLEEADEEYMLPAWAALIAAYERTYLFGFIHEAYSRGATTVYCDTDSIKTDTRVVESMIDDGVISIGREYGQWKHEGTSHDFVVIGPKVYYGHFSGVEVKRAKGIPKRKLTQEMYEQYLSGVNKPVHYESLSTVSRIKQHGMPIQIVRARSLSDLAHSQAWNVDREGNITPVSL